jgi:cell division topological specificity factor
VVEMENPGRSRDVAKQRLSQVLVYDRACVSPELMNALKWELIGAAEKFVHVDRNRATVQLELAAETSTLVIRLPVMCVGRGEPGGDEPGV